MKEIEILERQGTLDNELGDFLFGEKYVNLLEQKDLEENEILLLISLILIGSLGIISILYLIANF